MTRLLCCVFILSALVPPLQTGELSAQDSGLRAEPRIVSQGYCRADADLFSVTIKLDIKVFNKSKKPVYLASTMTPWIAKVAKSSEDARAGNYLYQVSWSHYPTTVAASRVLPIAPEKQIVIHSGYDLIARQDPTFDYPNSVSPGRYALVLVLRPEQVGPASDKQVADVITTEPFTVKIPKHPTLRTCN
jgi:hypothetical protein